ncbi:MAG TPA: magnesium transporter CorA family protein [Polyangiaceae bacterium]
MILAKPEENLGACTWIDLVSPTDEEAKKVEAATGLRIPTKDEIAEIESSSRLSFENGAFYVSMPLIALGENGEHVLAAIGFVLSSKVLISIRFAKHASFDAAHASCTAHSIKTAEAAFLRVLEIIVDKSADILEHAGTECDTLSHNAFRSQATPKHKGEQPLLNALRRVGAVADKTSHIRDTLLGIGRIAAFMTETDFEDAPKVSVGRMKAIRADVASLTDYESHLSGKIQFLLDATLGFINVEQNEIVKTLTIASVVGIPPVLIAGIYGMNFQHMPELTWYYGYPLAMIAIVVSGVIPLLWFKKRGWM